MHRGAMAVSLAALLLTLATVGSGVQASQRSVLVSGEHLRTDEVSLVHVAVDPQQDVPRPPADGVDLLVTIVGPGESMQHLEKSIELSGQQIQLFSLVWTPEEPGEHTLVAAALGGDEVIPLGEQTVHVEEKKTTPTSWMPSTAPGTVQWAIAFALLFLVTRASFDRD